MSDDMWRERRDRDDFSDYGSLFDDAEPTQNIDEVAGKRQKAKESEAITFGASDTGNLPHWTDPPTGEVPRLDVESDAVDDDEELDVWSSFSSESPVWQEDEASEAQAPAGDRKTGQQRRVDDPKVSGQTRRVSGESEVVTREPSRITIGTDPSGIPRRPPTSSGRRRGAPPPSTARRTGPPPKSGRDMPVAIAVGLLLAAVFLAALMYEPWTLAVLVCIVVGLGAVEFYDKVSEKGYRPATVIGIIACVATPIATYWAGERALPLILALGFVAISFTFIGAKSLEAAPMPNMAITTLGVVWIGFLGSFAALILRYSKGSGFPVAEGFLSTTIGTDTLCLLAIGVVANDIGALMLGSAAGKTPLRAWISPNKSVEGLFGGTVATILAMVIVGLTDRSTTWNSAGDLIVLAIVISVMAPLGDLTESMFKRNLDVKDFGTLIKGHGGVLDRFDGFLFTLPAVYYLLQLLEPWATK